MEKAILLAAAACCCTAAASVCQRMGAKTSQTSGFDIWLMFRLARRPVWLLGIASMIAGFFLQLTALRFGALALVQPILAAELVLVFGYLAVAGSGRVKRRDWLAAAAMSAGIGVFLRVASPSGGRLHAPGSSWLVAGLATADVVLLALAVAFGLGRRRGASGTRRAAVLGAATGISWGFMAAVIKELSSHLDAGLGALFSTWSLYLLIAAGAATMLLASHALAAGPLAASQPGFTILDPVSASLLGVFLFGEHIRTGAADLAGEALALAVVIAAAAILSHSCHIADQNSHPSSPVKPPVSSAANSPPAAAGRCAARPGDTGGVLSGARPGNRAGTATTTGPRHRPGRTSPATMLGTRRRSPAPASRAITRPSSRRAAGWPRCPLSGAGATQAPRAARTARQVLTNRRWHGAPARAAGQVPVPVTAARSTPMAARRSALVRLRAPALGGERPEADSNGSYRPPSCAAAPNPLSASWPKAHSSPSKASPAARSSCCSTGCSASGSTALRSASSALERWWVNAPCWRRAAGPPPVRAVTDCVIATAAKDQIDWASLASLAEMHHREDPDR